MINSTTNNLRRIATNMKKQDREEGDSLDDLPRGSRVSVGGGGDDDSEAEAFCFEI